MDDLISRQAAIDALRTCYDTETISMDNGDEYINYSDAVGEIEQLPSAQPTYTDAEIQKIQDLEQAQIEKAYQLGYEQGKRDALAEQKKGKWVHGREIAREMVGDAITAIFYEGWQCSECKCIVEEEREPLWNFCPNCGAKMEEEEDGKDSR